MSKMSKDFIKVSEAYWAFDHPGEICMSVKIDTFSSMLKSYEPIMLGIAEAVKEYVKENHADAIYKAVETEVQKYVQKAVEEHVNRKAMEIISKLDITAMVNLAAIGAAKNLGNSLTNDK